MKKFKRIITALLIVPLYTCNLVEFDRTITIYNETGDTIKDIYIIPENELPDLSTYSTDQEFADYCDNLHTDQLPDEVIDETTGEISEKTLPDEGNIVINLETINPNISDFVAVSFDDYDIAIKNFTDSEEYIIITANDYHNFYEEIGVFTP